MASSFSPSSVDLGLSVRPWRPVSFIPQAVNVCGGSAKNRVMLFGAPPPPPPVRSFDLQAFALQTADAAGLAEACRKI
jgi:hypothetical protein